MILPNQVVLSPILKIVVVSEYLEVISPIVPQQVLYLLDIILAQSTALQDLLELSNHFVVLLWHVVLDLCDCTSLLLFV